jgi:hypothetical protein
LFEGLAGLIFLLGSLSLLPSSSLILILSLLHNNLTLVFYHAYDNKLVTFAFGEYTPHLKKKVWQLNRGEFGGFFYVDCYSSHLLGQF